MTRTPEEIMTQLEARYVELEKEANSPRRQRPCKTCKWFDASYGVSGSCMEPLVIGFEERWPLHFGKVPDLCGSEKALWQPIDKSYGMFRRFREWILT